MKRLFCITILVLALCIGTIMPLTQVSATENMGIYSWSGQWKTNWGDMTLTQTGAKVTGTYTFDSGKIEGTVSGNTLTGTWSEAPSYAPPRDAGEVEFVMSADGKSFSGKWRYGSEGDWGGWDGGTRDSEVLLETPKPYSKASSWATTELEKADDAGLIPDILKGADLTKPITREEFCELALLLYEKSTGKSPAPTSPNPFTDTKNPQVLKAFALGITTGASATNFSPQVLINREQCAAMLFRAIKAIHSGGAYSVAGIPDFPDQKDISAYAVEAAKYMSNLGIVKGDMKGNFMPKAITDAQTAAGYGMATREAAILMSVRSFEQMDTIKASKVPSVAAPEPTPAQKAPIPAPAAPAAPAPVVGTWVLGNLSGGQFNAGTGKYEGGASGLGQIYTFKADGTYTALVIWSNAMYFTGRYSVKDGVLTLTGRAVEESNDGGKTWGAKETLPDTSAHFTAGTDDTGKYLLIGEEGAVPPLVDKKNALKYKFTTTPKPEPASELPATEPAKTGDLAEGLIGLWGYSDSNGSVHLDVMYEFKADGTFYKITSTMIAGGRNGTEFKGKYRISGNKLILFDQLKSTGPASSHDFSSHKIWYLTMDSYETKDVPAEDAEWQISRTEDDELTMSTTLDQIDVTQTYNRGR